ncbi:MAG: hypothetical protein Q4E12_05695 [Coriobacteriia bacterium]|nr:hypothetical protein [Coriobacteriia bacterium]
MANQARKGAAVLLSACLCVPWVSVPALADEQQEQPATVQATEAPTANLDPAPSVDVVPNTAGEASNEADETAVPDPSAETNTSDTGEEQSHSQLTQSAAEATVLADVADDSNLNYLWETAANADGNLLITQGGTYQLTADLTVKGYLSINAPGETVVIQMNGYTLTSHSHKANGSIIDVVNAASVTIEGDAAKKSTLYFNGGPIYYAIHSAAAQLSVSGITIKTKADDDNLSLSDLMSSGVYATKGAVSLSNLAIDIDLTNQGNTETSSNSSTKRGPAALYFESGVTSAQVDNVSATVRNSTVVTVRDASSITNVGYAMGLYSGTSGDVSVSGCSFDVTSALGSAIGVAGANVVLTGAQTTISVSGFLVSAGVYAPAKQAVSLDAPLSVSFGAQATQVQTALYSPVQQAFVIKAGFAGENLGVWAGATSDSANGDGMVFAWVEDGVQNAAALFVNAKGESGACTIAQENSLLKFKLDVSKSVVKLTHAGKDTFFGSITEALEAAESGDCVTLLKDYGNVVCAKALAASQQITIDLANCCIDSLAVSSNGSVIVKNGSIVGRNASTNAAVTYSGSGALLLEDTQVSCVSSTSLAYGVLSSGQGELSLSNTKVTAAASRSAAYGVSQSSASAGNLTITGGSITVNTLSVGVAAYGVYANGSDNQVHIESCPLIVTGSSIVTRGIDVRNRLAYVGQAGAIDIQVVSSQRSSSVSGVYARATASKSAQVSLVDCGIDVACAEEAGTASYWCVANSSASYGATWQLEGECSFGSCTNTHLQVVGNPLSLGETFSPSQSAIVVGASQLQDDLFASAPATLSDTVAQAFLPAPGCAYEGYAAQAQQVQGEDGARLNIVWQRAACVRNANQGTVFTSLADAIQAAAPGDTLMLTADYRQSATLAVDKAVSIDLAGHSLALAAGDNASATASGTGGALVYTAAGTLVLKNSQPSTGVISVQVGASTETASSAKYGYQGMVVDGGGALQLEDVSVEVAYAGGSVSMPQVSLRGIRVVQGSLLLCGQTYLSVTAAPEDGTYGASCVTGISQGEASSGQVVVEESAQVTVNNNAYMPEQEPAIWPDDYTSTSGATASQNAYLLEIHPDEDSSLYQLIQETFKARASFDSLTDKAGYENGANIYYVTNVSLENGLNIWAYSDPVDSSHAGLLDAIVASRIFVRSGYDVALQAYGITCDEAFSGSVTVAGAVDVRTTAGNAIGVYENAAANWTVSENKLTAAATQETYRQASSSRMDLASKITFDTKLESPVSYPSDAKYFEVSFVSSVAKGVGIQGDSYAQVVTNSDYYPGCAQDTENLQVGITFTGMHAADGSFAPNQQVTVPYGQTLAQSGVAQVIPADYESNEMIYRFIGWKVIGATMDYAYDPEYLYADLAIDSNLNGVSSTGAIQLQAVYVPLSAGQHLITFKVQYGVCAYGVDDGEVPSYQACFNSNSRVVPSSLLSLSGYSLVFKGWSDGWDASYAYENGMSTYTSSLLEATEDATYTARYAQTLVTQTLMLTYRVATDRDLVLTEKELKNVDWTQDCIDMANSVAKPGDLISYGGQDYEFLGWSTRVSDKQPLYTDSLYCTATNSFANSYRFYAVYAVAEQAYSANFYVDGELWSSAENLSTTDTIYAAWQKSTNPVTPESPYEKVSFRGWNTNPASDKILSASVVAVSSLALQDSRSVDLYAIWTIPTVTFYAPDRTTVLDTIQVPAGSSVMDVLGETFVPDSQTGDPELFRGWALSDGTAFSLTDPITESIKVVAVYAEADSGTGNLNGPTNTNSAVVTNTNTGNTNSATPSAAATPAAAAVASAATPSSAAAVAASASTSSLSAVAAAAADADEALAVADASSAMALSLTEELSEGDSSELDNAEGAVYFYALLLLAAVGAGGLLWWFLRRHQGEDDDGDPLELQLGQAESITF